MAITRVGEATTKSGTSATTAITTALPAGIAAGDVLILEVATGLGPYDLTDPAGWTPLRRVGDQATLPAEAAIEVWWKVAGASSSDGFGTQPFGTSPFGSGTVGSGSDVAPTLTAATATRWHTCIRAFRGVNTSAPFLTESARAEPGNGTAATHTAPPLTNTDPGAWGLFSLASRQVATPYTATPGAGLTQRVDQDSGNINTANLLFFAADSNGPVSPGSVTYSATGSSGSAVAVMWAAFLAPAGGAPTIAGATAFATVSAPAGVATGAVGGPIDVAGATAVVVAVGGNRSEPPAPGTDPVLWPPDPYRQVIRSGGYELTYSLKANVGGVPVEGAQDLRPTGGTITDTTKPGVRRVMSLNLAPEPGLFDMLSPVGTTLQAFAHVTYLNRTVQTLSMGVFDVDTETLSEGGGGLSLTAPDKWVRIQRARFIRPQASNPNMLVVDQIIQLIRGALGSSETVVVSATSEARVGALVWEKDRDQAIIDLAASIGAWVFFDRDGVATIADIPTIGASADWLVDASASGVLISLDRERSRTDTRNIVVVESSAADGARFPTQYVWDNNPDSPTFAGPGLGFGPVPPSPDEAGPFGQVPYFHDTPILSLASEAIAAGLTILARTSGLASQVSLTSAPNPALDAFDVLDVLPLRERYDIARVLERHVADVVTHSLSGGAQQIEGRSTRAEQEGGS